VAKESKLLLSSIDRSLFRLFERSKPEGMNTSSGARIFNIGKESLFDIAEALLGSLEGLFIALIFQCAFYVQRAVGHKQTAAERRNGCILHCYNKIGNIFVGMSDQILESTVQISSLHFCQYHRNGCSYMDF
jgi:hypothetical protein